VEELNRIIAKLTKELELIKAYCQVLEQEVLKNNPKFDIGAAKKVNNLLFFIFIYYFTRYLISLFFFSLLFFLFQQLGSLGTPTPALGTSPSPAPSITGFVSYFFLFIF